MAWRTHSTVLIAIVGPVPHGHAVFRCEVRHVSSVPSRGTTRHVPAYATSHVRHFLTESEPARDTKRRGPPKKTPPDRSAVHTVQVIDSVDDGTLVERTGDHVELLLLGELDEVHRVAGDTHGQVRVLLRVLDGILELLLA